jgi:hypothetical protein
MPTLANVRYERLAKALAEGKSQEVAYGEAGFASANADSNASRLLKKRPEIMQRVEELRRNAETRKNELLERSLSAAAVSKTYVLKRLHEIVERCMQHYPVLDRNGEQVYVETPDGKLCPAFTFDAKNAKSALHLLGLEMGMFVHRVRFDKSPLDDLPAETLKGMMENLLALREGRIIEHNGNGSGDGADKPALVDRSASAGGAG